MNNPVLWVCSPMLIQWMVRFWCIALSRYSIAKMYKFEDSGQPCIVSFLITNGFNKCLFTLAIGIVNNAFILSTYVVGKPTCNNTACKKHQFTL